MACSRASSIFWDSMKGRLKHDLDAGNRQFDNREQHGFRCQQAKGREAIATAGGVSEAAEPSVASRILNPAGETLGRAISTEHSACRRTFTATFPNKKWATAEETAGAQGRCRPREFLRPAEG